jgi:hypothetical protein
MKFKKCQGKKDNLQINVLKATTANNPCIKNPKVSVRSHFTDSSLAAIIVVLAKVVDLVEETVAFIESVDTLEFIINKQ